MAFVVHVAVFPDLPTLLLFLPESVDGVATSRVVAMVGGLGLLHVAVIRAQVHRYRAVATAVERQQIRWALAPVLVLGVILILAGVVALLPGGGARNFVQAALTSTPVLALALAGGFVPAVLRHRLYEIDRILSRTMTYAAVTSVLLAVYATIVVLRSAVFELESDLLVAAATLAAAGVFVPVRRQVQATVDRRFNRSRYDAKRVVERFGTRLREDVNLDSLSGDLHAAVASTVQPVHVSLWLRKGRR